MAFLCFLFPIVGLILYLIWKDDKPLMAKSCGKGALIGVILYFVSIVFWTVITVMGVGIFAASGALDDYQDLYDTGTIFIRSLIH